MILAYSLRAAVDELNSYALGTSDSKGDYDSLLGECETIGSLYFSSLESHVNRVVQAFRDYAVIVLTFRHERLKNETTFDITSFSSKIREPYKRLLDDIGTLAKEASSLAKEFT